MQDSNSYRKIRVFYADDLATNIISLLRSLELAGIVLPTDDEKKKLKFVRVDSPDILQHNKDILESDCSLVYLNYSTRVHDAIKTIASHDFSYDLVICDLYFGEDDPDFRDSKVGGMWIILWAKHKASFRKIISKIYSGQRQIVSAHIDFQMAERFLRDQYQVQIEQVEKLQDSSSWRDNLIRYFDEVRNNIIPDIIIDHRIKFVNELTRDFSRDVFNNFHQDKKLAEFRKRIDGLKDREFEMIDGLIIKLVNLFPILLGKRIFKVDKENFANMSDEELENILYTNELTYKSKDERQKKIEDLQSKNVAFNLFKKHDSIGNPIYGLKLLSEEYNEGLISKLERPFIQSFNYTYRISQFFFKQRGFGTWSRDSSMFPIGQNEFNRIRTEYIIPEFQKIRECFVDTFPFNDPPYDSLDDEIYEVLLHIDESHFWEEHKWNEQRIESGLQRIGKEHYFNQSTGATRVPLKTLLRLNLSDYLKIILKVKPDADPDIYEDDEFIVCKNKKLYWYCNAVKVRYGLKKIIQNMFDSDARFCLLEAKDNDRLSIVKYKLVIKDTNKGVPSIIRKFYSNEEDKFLFDHFLKGYCYITIRSKMADFDGTSFDLLSGQDERLCKLKTSVGTEFHIMFMQTRER